MWITPVERIRLELSGSHSGVASMHGELMYYRRRLAEEIAAASAASDPKVSSVHLELARRYDARVKGIEAARRRSSLHLVGAA